MIRCINKALLVIVCLFWGISIWGCAGRTYLIVDYQVPVASQQLNGVTIKLEIEDQRTATNLMTSKAARHFKAFKERYSLAWIMSDNMRILAGEHDLSALFKTALEKRLSSMGADITLNRNSQAPLLAVSLEKFALDLKGRKWMVDVSYQASLTKEGHPITKERIKGNAERIRVLGRKGADLVVSDIFTEAVNRLDILKLIKKAGLLQ